ncbi:MAG: thiol:disulfide interchange protein DsbA/DsbL, partial [Burkholderiales bacterium]
MSLRLLRLAVVTLCALFSAGVGAQSYQEGEQYARLEPPRPVSTGNGVEVIEFFYYGCAVCYEAEPQVVRWLAKAGGKVQFVRVPAVPQERWAGFARTYYALEAIGELGRLNWPLYDNHHFDGRRLDEEPNLLKWLSANGVDAQRFREIRNSAAVTAKIDAAKKMLKDYDIKRVPTFV